MKCILKLQWISFSSVASQVAKKIASTSVKARSHDPILRIRFLVLKIGSRRSDGPISKFRFVVRISEGHL